MTNIIIPVLNEEKVLEERAAYYASLRNMGDIIFVDGGSTDRTVEIAQNYGEVVSSQPGRAIQKNRGAEQASADHLLFLHADLSIRSDTLESIDKALKEGAAGGCLTMRIDDKKWIFRLCEWTVNFRARAFGVTDGNLGTFVRRDVFEQIGRFDALPVMEDITFGKKLRKAGRLSVLPDIVHVSSRKWYEKGFIRTLWGYACAYIRLWTGRLK